VVFVVLADLLLTIRVYRPRARIPALPSEKTDVELGGSNSKPAVYFDYGTTGQGRSNKAHKHGVGIMAGWGEMRKEKLYIASIHWNDGPLLSAHWIPALLNFIREYGASNLYISILESGSWDETKSLLRSLDSELERLGVERSIILEDRTHEDEVNKVPEEGEKGWIWGTRGKKEMRRIPYLAAARNRAMGPLREMSQKAGKEKRLFDRVIWLNDVIFTVCLPFLPSPFCPTLSSPTVDWRIMLSLIRLGRRNKSPYYWPPETALTPQPAPLISQSQTKSTTPSRHATVSAFRPRPSSGLTSPRPLPDPPL
jgi:hypothetical protein